MYLGFGALPHLVGYDHLDQDDYFCKFTLSLVHGPIKILIVMKYSFAIILGLMLLSPGWLCGQITMVPQKEGVLVLDNADSVLFYQIAPKSLQGKYSRNHYIHPLWNVDGMVLTEDFPADHLHQRGIFWAWHQIIIDGQRSGDGWSLDDFTQEVLATGWEVRNDGSSVLTTQVIWKSDLHTRNGKPVPYLLESTDIVVHPREEKYRKLDFIIRLEAINAKVGIGGSEDEKGYSGFSVRIKLPEDVEFHGPDGPIMPRVTAVSSPGFVDVSGTYDGTKAGVIIGDHPENPQYPQSWILRASKSMQNAAFPGREVVTIKPGTPLKLQYSVVTYVGDTPGDILRELKQQK